MIEGFNVLQALGTQHNATVAEIGAEVTELKVSGKRLVSKNDIECVGLRVRT